MRTIERSTAFRKDFKREKAGRHGRKLDELLTSVLAALTTDQQLPQANQGHPLSGEWQGYRECHLRPNLLLIYRKSEANILKLVRLGSHSELFE
jgi:mRNA interferase YafQ